MPRPDIKSTVIEEDTPAEGAPEGDQPNELENPTDPQIDNPVDEPGGDADADRGAEDKEAGGDDPAAEGAAGGEEEGAGEDVNGGHDFAKIKEQMREELRTELLAELKGAPPADASPKEISDEEWAKHEESWGIPRKAITATVSRMERLAKHFEARLDERMAKFEKNDALRTLAAEKGFNDALRYQKDIDEFLSHYHPKHHSNPDLLKRAVIYSRGKNMKANVNRARVETERNRRIAGAARPAAGGAPVKKGLESRPLTAIEKSAARAANMTDAEYAKHKASSRVLA